MTASKELREVYRPGKKAKKVIKPRPARHLGHPHSLTSGNDIHRHPMPDEGATRVPRPSPITKNHAQMVERNLEILAEEDGMMVRGEEEIFEEKLALVPAEVTTPGRRAQYAALETHKEMAATIMAAGGTEAEAADWAGVTTSTVGKYLTDEDFRRRIEERRSLIKAKIGGRIEAWMDRRTADPDALDSGDPKTTLAIYDRISARPGVGTNVHLEQNNVNIHSYPDLMERLARIGTGAAPTVHVVDASDEGGAFPTVGVDGPAVADGVPSGD